MDSYVKLVGPPPDDYLPLIRELLSFDMLCPKGCEMVRDGNGHFQIFAQPSSLHWSRQVEWPWALQETNLYYFHNCLDIGGGWGVFKYPLANRVNRVDVLDISDAFVKEAKQISDSLGFGGKVYYRVGDVRSIPYVNDRFDRVFCISVLEHFKDDHDKAIDEMIRVLAPGGTILLTMDVAYEKSGDDNFYIDRPKAIEILARLGLQPPQDDGAPILISRMEKEEVSVFTLLVKYTKPLKG